MTFTITRLNQTIQHTAGSLKSICWAAFLLLYLLLEELLVLLFILVTVNREYCQSDSATCESPTFLFFLFEWPL